MFDILKDAQKDDVVAVKVSGQIETKDYERLTPLIEQKIREHGNVNMFFELEDIEKVDFGAMWEEMKFDGKDSGNVKKVAIVGAQAQEKMLGRIKNMLSSSETKFFDPEDRDAALKWIQ